MKTFSKILVPHDFSDYAKHAVDVAADVARRYEANLTLIHVHQPMLLSVPESYLLYESSKLPLLLEALAKQLEQARQQALALGVLQVDSQILQGAPVSEITRFAREGGYSLIVMGTHGRTGVAHALIGSVTERVVRNAPCPVLTTRLSD
jgi:nucleotide-binding universal stress UspA family protein